MNDENIIELIMGVKEFNFKEGDMPICAIALKGGNDISFVYSRHIIELSENPEIKQLTDGIGDMLIEIGTEMNKSKNQDGTL